MEPLFFDMESFSEAPIKTSGAAKYVRDPSTEALMITWAFREGPVFYHDLANDGPMPLDLRMALTDPTYTKIAANIPFDRGLLKEVKSLQVTIPWSQCADSHILAYSLGFTGGLGAIGAQVGLPEDKLKLKEGKKLILRFCKIQPSSHNVARWTKDNDPENWEKFKQYAIMDTEAMRALWMKLEPYDSMSDTEWDHWRDTQRMNERGLPVDPALVARAIKMTGIRKNEIKGEMIELTGLDNPNSGVQLTGWLKEQGVDLPNLQAATIDHALDGGVLGALPHKVLQLKRVYGQTAVTKWASIQKMSCLDNTLKGMFTFMGASRTGRDASRGINLQNLRHPPPGDMNEHVSYLYYGDLPLISLIYGEPLDFLARTTRGAITAPLGKLLAVSDLSSIESRVLGWLAGSTRMNNIFSSDMDTYKDFATELFNCRYEEVTKAQRNFSKPPVLGAGYMMGGIGLAAYGANMGVDMTVEEAQRSVNMFRSIYPEIPQLWGWLMQAVEYTVTSHSPCEGYGLKFTKEGDFLFITLPSGRRISYFDPVWRMWDTPIGEKMSFTYMGINRYKSSNPWERIAAHAGGVTENIIQAIARDILIVWVRRCRELHTVARVHDEFIVVVDEALAESTLAIMNHQAAIPITWAPSLLLKAEGFITKHYQKD